MSAIFKPPKPSRQGLFRSKTDKWSKDKTTLLSASSSNVVMRRAASVSCVPPPTARPRSRNHFARPASTFESSSSTSGTCIDSRTRHGYYGRDFEVMLSELCDSDESGSDSGSPPSLSLPRLAYPDSPALGLYDLGWIFGVGVDGDGFVDGPQGDAKGNASVSANKKTPVSPVDKSWVDQFRRSVRARWDEGRMKEKFGPRADVYVCEYYHHHYDIIGGGETVYGRKRIGNILIYIATSVDEKSMDLARDDEYVKAAMRALGMGDQQPEWYLY